MKRFSPDYARYYNLLYADKDYVGETDFIIRLIQDYSPNAHKILDLGCGTGRHANLLAEKLYCVHGVDMSEGMLSLARELQNKNGLKFSLGDIRTVRLSETFDVVISLFHVMSYQTSNEDIRKSLITAYEHLQDNGIFIFDCWYGPAVLCTKPSVRIKRLEDDELEITRIAEPVLHINENVVDVNYQVFIQDTAKNITEVLSEKHCMRYLFKPEIEEVITSIGFGILSCEEWMTRKIPSFDSWNVVFVLQK
jgi:SAM-dependent methyltransferase